MDITTLLKNPSIWTIISVLVFILYAERKSLLAMVSRRAAEKVKQTLSNGEYSKGLVETLVQTLKDQREDFERLVEIERAERRSLSMQVQVQISETQRMATTTIEIMKDFVDIARMSVDKQDQLTSKVTEIMEGVCQILNGIGFVLAQLYFRDRGKTFDDLVGEMERSSSNDRKVG
jgi:hypothetical protein